MHMTPNSSWKCMFIKWNLFVIIKDNLIESYFNGKSALAIFLFLRFHFFCYRMHSETFHSLSPYLEVSLKLKCIQLDEIFRSKWSIYFKGLIEDWNSIESKHLMKSEKKGLISSLVLDFPKPCCEMT